MAHTDETSLEREMNKLASYSRFKAYIKRDHSHVGKRHDSVFFNVVVDKRVFIDAISGSLLPIPPTTRDQAGLGCSRRDA